MYKKDHVSGDIWIVDLLSKRAAIFLEASGANLFQAQYSPGDHWLALLKMQGGKNALYVIPLRKGVPAQRQAWIPVVVEETWVDKPRWSPDGNLLYFLSDRDGFRCVWSQRLNPVAKSPEGAPTPVYHFHNHPISILNVPIGSVELEVIRDRLLITLGEVTGNIWSARTGSAR